MCVTAGVDVNARSKDGRTTLHVAAWQGHASIAQLLLAAGIRELRYARLVKAWHSHLPALRALAGARGGCQNRVRLGTDKQGGGK